MSALARSDGRPLAVPDRVRRLGPDLALAALLALGAALVVVEMQGFSFFQDEWGFIAGRQGWTLDTFLQPAGPHLSIVPILVFKVMLEVFGAGSYGPWKVLAAFDMVVLAATIGLFARGRWGPWWGLVPVALIVTLGPGARTLLWPYQVGYTLATAAGVVALVMAARGDRRSDAIACAAVVFSLASASQGVGVLAGVAVIVLLDEGRRRRWWVIAIPAVLYGLWYLQYGRQASETDLSQWPHLPSYVGHSFAATVGALVGLAPPALGAAVVDTGWGSKLSVLVVLGLAYALYRGWRPNRLVLAVAVTLLVLWVAAGLSNTTGDRPPNSERYVAPDAMLLLVAVCAAVTRPRIPTRWAALILVVVAAICIHNAGDYAAERGHFAGPALASRSELGALLVARDVAPEHLRFPKVDPAAMPGFPIGSYLSAVDKYGTNAYTPAQILQQDTFNRQHADVILIRTERLALNRGAAAAGGPSPVQTGGGAATPAGSCAVLGSSGASFIAPAAGVLIEAGAAGVLVRVQRFSVTSIRFNYVTPGTKAFLRLPRDRAPQVPWRLVLKGTGGRVCSLA